MPDPIRERLSALPTLSKAALWDLWKQFFHSAPSSQLRRDFKKMHSDPSVPVLRDDCASSVGHSTKEVIPAPLALRASGQEHDWFVSGAIKFTSCMCKAMGTSIKALATRVCPEIARLITGTRWSGPLFFGIKRELAGTKSAEIQ